MEQADREAHQQNLLDRIFWSTAAPVAATALASEAATAEAPATVSTSPPAILSTVTGITATDDGDGDLVVASKPKSADVLDVFVADFGNASSHVNAVTKNQKQKTERCKHLAHCNGVASHERPENIVKHKGIGVMNHDEVDDDDTEEFDDQEVEQHPDDVGGDQDLEEFDEEHAAEHDQEDGAEHEEYDEEHCEQNDGCAEEWIGEGAHVDDHAEHAWEGGYAEWDAEEDECHDDEEDYGEYGDGRWDIDGGRCSENDDDDMWADLW